MDGMCDTWCTGCEFLNQWGPVFCDYIGMTGRRRPCPPGMGCTERTRHARVRPDKRLEQQEADLLARRARELAAKRARERALEQLRMAETDLPDKRIRARYHSKHPAAPGLEEQAKAIWSWRNLRGIRQSDLAAMLGVCRNTVQKWEHGTIPADWKLLETVGCRL